MGVARLDPVLVVALTIEYAFVPITSPATYMRYRPSESRTTTGSLRELKGMLEKSDRLRRAPVSSVKARLVGRRRGGDRIAV